VSFTPIYNESARRVSQSDVGGILEGAGSDQFEVRFGREEGYSPTQGVRADHQMQLVYAAGRQEVIPRDVTGEDQDVTGAVMSFAGYPGDDIGSGECGRGVNPRIGGFDRALSLTTTLGTELYRRLMVRFTSSTRVLPVLQGPRVEARPR
jgi:hypothetical protein